MCVAPTAIATFFCDFPGPFRAGLIVCRAYGAGSRSLRVRRLLCGLYTQGRFLATVFQTAIGSWPGADGALKCAATRSSARAGETPAGRPTPRFVRQSLNEG